MGGQRFESPNGVSAGQKNLLSAPKTCSLWLRAKNSQKSLWNDGMTNQPPPTTTSKAREWSTTKTEILKVLQGCFGGVVEGKPGSGQPPTNHQKKGVGDTAFFESGIKPAGAVGVPLSRLEKGEAGHAGCMGLCIYCGTVSNIHIDN